MQKQKAIYGQNDRVIIHSLGDKTPGEFGATVCGVFGTIGADTPVGHTFYIVQLDNMKPIDPNYKFSHFTVTEACLRVDPTSVPFKFELGDTVEFADVKPPFYNQSTIATGTVENRSHETSNRDNTPYNDYVIRLEPNRTLMVPEFLLTKVK